MQFTERLIKSRTGFRWLVLPFLLLLFIFWVYPLLQGIESSLSPDNPQEGQEYSTFHNYEKMANQKNFKIAVSNTAKFIFYSVITIIPLSIYLAFVLMKMTKRLRYFSAFCLLIPSLIPPAIIGLLFNMTFNGRAGIINQIFIIPFGGKAIDWMNNPNYILMAMVIQSVWRWTGFITLFLLCGLESVPKNVTEAAQLDGAGPIRRFFHIDLPAIRRPAGRQQPMVSGKSLAARPEAAHGRWWLGRDTLEENQKV